MGSVHQEAESCGLGGPFVSGHELHNVQNTREGFLSRILRMSSQGTDRSKPDFARGRLATSHIVAASDFGCSRLSRSLHAQRSPAGHSPRAPAAVVQTEPEHGKGCRNSEKSSTLHDVSRCALIPGLAQKNIYFRRNRRVGRSSNRVRAVQNDAPRKLAQRLPEQDNQPRIIDGPERVRNISNLSLVCPCRRSDHPSPDLRWPSCLSSVEAPFLRPGLQSDRALVAAAVKRSAQPRGATHSRLFAASLASTASTGP